MDLKIIILFVLINTLFIVSCDNDTVEGNPNLEKFNRKYEKDIQNNIPSLIAINKWGDTVGYYTNFKLDIK